MIKSDLIKTISKQYNLSTRQATAILQTCLDEIVSSLIKSDTVELRRFGVFKTKLQKVRTIKHPVTGKPIKFAGTGEKMDAIEPFHPDRMASRILGMGDVLTLIEKATEAMEFEEIAKQQKNKGPEDMTLDDFLDQMQQLKKMGPLQNVLGMLPGIGNKIKDIEISDDAMKKPEAIIRSMTLKERRKPDILNASRRKRIASGAGVTVQDVNQLMRQFDQMRKMMKQMMGNKRGLRGKMKMPPFN